MTKKGLALYDLQFPVHNQKLLPIVEQYMADEKWQYLVYGGDTMDMDAISHHAMASGNNRALEGKRLKQDYAEMAAILRRHRQIVGPDCEIYFLVGNHEEWAEKFIDRFPTLEGLLELAFNLPFEELNIKVIGARQYLKLGKLHFIHGDVGRGYTPTYHAKKIVETYNRNVVYGHHHTMQTATKVSPLGISETHSAWCLPCLADTNPDWNQGKPTPWLNGFGVFYIEESVFSVFPVVAARNRFVSPEGRLYQ